MSEKKSKEISVVTEQGNGVVESFFVSELDHLMMRVKHEDSWVNYPICNIQEILKLKGISLELPETILV